MALFLNLVEEKLIGLGKVRTETIVENIDEFRKPDLLIPSVPTSH